MCRLARLLLSKRPSPRVEAEIEPISEADELSRIFARLPPCDRAVLLHLGRKLADPS